MGGDCCAAPAPGVTASVDLCPANGAVGALVSFATLAAQIRGELPEPQELRVCTSADCAVVYFGSHGAVLRIDDLWQAPGFKSGGSDLVCYCFRKTRGDLAKDLRRHGESRLFDWIKGRVADRGCACEIRNPTGRCCLADVRNEIDALRAAAPPP